MEQKIEASYQEIYKKIENWGTDEMIKKVQEMSGINDKEYKDFSFCILLIFWTESTLKKVLEELLLNSQKPEKQYPELINLIFNETAFSSKIKITEFIINVNPKYKEEYKDFFSYCRELNQVRNQIFHTKLESIKYRGSLISDIKTQRRMLTDLIQARLKMGVNLKS